MTFNELNISAPIIKALAQKKYLSPTPIQEQAIPVALKGHDLLGIAQTGTGKTAAFAIPIIQQLNQTENRSKHRNIKALILTPTRELAIQIDECFNDYAEYTQLRHTAIFGGVGQGPQVDILKRGIDILIATPGRLLDLISQKHIVLSHIRHFVLDEADRMLDMGFIHDIKKILPLLPKQKQTLFFSATMPQTIANLSKSILNKPIKVEVAPVSSVVDIIEQKLYFVEKPDKSKLLIEVLGKEENKSVLVFSRTKHGADKIARILKKQGIDCEAIHGNKTQNARQRALTNFRSGKTRVIIATDIAARGIDVAHLEMVINYDLPDVAETYVHRIGRTGRAGNSGIALTFCTEDEKGMLKDIQKLTGKKLSVVNHSTHSPKNVKEYGSKTESPKQEKRRGYNPVRKNSDKTQEAYKGRNVNEEVRTINRTVQKY
ncbi:DEAD/DEAH box helicase [Bacteroides sp. 224]|uniref:DEAD/DEAH box helicase n=1 Tax=Bacteroides sp. 224 TaxID=2302936 RepID=UPI0013D0A9D4|nr:DEAD/DEAH box helicase [Bacteroides sp. 224]NDV67111.1 DEAD/DEAH box helicase [Bacteroides sp. 224]